MMQFAVASDGVLIGIFPTGRGVGNGPFELLQDNIKTGDFETMQECRDRAVNDCQNRTQSGHSPIEWKHR